MLSQYSPTGFRKPRGAQFSHPHAHGERRESPLPGPPAAPAARLLVCHRLGRTATAQDRLKQMPGYDQYQRISSQTNTAVRPAAINGTWSADSSGFDYALDGKRYRFDVASKQSTETGAVTDAAPAARRQGRRPRRNRDRARPAGGIGRGAERHAQGFLSRSQSLGRRRGRRGRVGDYDRRQRERPHQIRHRELGLRRGARPDQRYLVVARQLRRSPITASTRSRCSTTTCSSIRPRFRAPTTSRPTRSPGPQSDVDLFVYDVATKTTTRRRP